MSNTETETGYDDQDFQTNLRKLVNAAERLHLSRLEAMERLERKLFVLLGAQGLLLLRGVYYDWMPGQLLYVVLWMLIGLVTFLLGGLAIWRWPSNHTIRIVKTITTTLINSSLLYFLILNLWS